MWSTNVFANDTNDAMDVDSSRSRTFVVALACFYLPPAGPMAFLCTTPGALATETRGCAWCRQ
jgi:hypothetical protein